MFNAEELGDRKPFQLLHYIQQLLEDKASTTDGAFLHELFLQRLQCFQQYGVIINPAKCELGADTLQFLGQQVD